MTSEEKDAHVLKLFNRQFSLQCDKHQMSKLMSNPSVQKWSEQLKAEMGAELGLPDHWRQAGLTPSQWQEFQGVVGKRKKLRQEMALRQKEAAETYHNKVKALKKELLMGLGATDSPLVYTLELGFNDLSLAAQAAIEKGKPDKETRDGRVAKALAELRRNAVEHLNDTGERYRVV
jgi:hypothetical protein